MDCEDGNSCTLDTCAGGRCYHNLKCDGSTCARDSADYCSNCEHCGDGIANCEETFCSCPIDVKLPAAQGVAISSLAKEAGISDSWRENISIKPANKFSVMLVIASSGKESVENVKVENALPENLIYQDNLKVDGVPFAGNILKGIDLGKLSPGQSKVITFDAKAADPDNFAMGSTYLNNVSTVYYGTDKSVADNIGIEVVKTVEGAAAAGTIFSQIIRIVGMAAFWLVMLFLLILAVVSSLVWYYFAKKRKAEQFA